MFRICAIFALLFAVALAMSTTTVPGPSTTLGHLDAKILYDQKHHKAMIVRTDGCYEYHMNHQDVVDSQNDATRPVLETRMLKELAATISLTETGHHHIDHMTQDIRTACAALPVYTFDVHMGD